MSLHIKGVRHVCFRAGMTVPWHHSSEIQAPFAPCSIIHSTGLPSSRALLSPVRLLEPSPHNQVPVRKQRNRKRIKQAHAMFLSFTESLFHKAHKILLLTYLLLFYSYRESRKTSAFSWALCHPE